MGQINQIQMRFEPVEDRILMRVNTTDSMEFQFWLTRRYVKLLWQVLLRMMEKDQQVAVHADEQTRKEVLAFQHQETAQQMDYSQNFDEQAAERPLGDAPILLSQISVKPADNGDQVLSVLPEQGQGIDIAMNQTLLHSVFNLLQQTLERTDWDLDLSLALATDATTVVPESKAIN